MKLNLASGKNPKEGYVNVDISEDANPDVVLDILQFPWPWEDASVERIDTEHFVEHIPMAEYDGVDGLIRFVDECHRVLKPGGELRILHPYCMSGRAFWDPTHRRFIHEMTWHYFSRGWREKQSLDHYPIKSNFDVITVAGMGIPPDVQLRSAETQQWMRERHWNVVGDLEVLMRKV